MRANVINPPFDRRLGNRNQEQGGKDQRNLSETDAAYYRQIAAQPDDAFAHMLGGRDTLDIRGKVHALLLVVQVGALSNDKPIFDWIMEGREFIADFRSRKLTHNGQGQGYSKTTGRLRNRGIGRHPLSRAASRRIGLCARLSKRTTMRSACT